MHEIKILYKMSCDRCVEAIDNIDKFVKMCGIENKVFMKKILIQNEKDAKKFGFNPSLSPMILIDGKYIGSGKKELCKECTKMCGEKSVCGLPINEEVLSKMKNLLCKGIECSC